MNDIYMKELKAECARLLAAAAALRPQLREDEELRQMAMDWLIAKPWEGGGERGLGYRAKLTSFARDDLGLSDTLGRQARGIAEYLVPPDQLKAERDSRGLRDARASRDTQTSIGGSAILPDDEYGWRAAGEPCARPECTSPKRGHACYGDESQAGDWRMIHTCASPKS